MPREILGLQDRQLGLRSEGLVHKHEVIEEGLIYLSQFAVADVSHAVLEFEAPLWAKDDFEGSALEAGRPVALSDVPMVCVGSDAPSTKVGDQRLVVRFGSCAGAGAFEQSWAVELKLSVVRLRLVADEDRDGMVDGDDTIVRKDKAPWRGGADGYGAIVLVNSDRDTAYPNGRFRDRLDARVNGPLDLKDMTPLRLSFEGPAGLELWGFSLRLHASDAAASRLRVFDVTEALPRTLVQPGESVVPLGAVFGTRSLVVEGLDYPDGAFSGLLSLHVELEKNYVSYARDTVVMRVAPWMALPNTQPAKTVYVATMADKSNVATIRDLRKVAAAAEVELVEVPPSQNRGDRWLQDEIEIGYASRPGHVLSVVLDSPRDRGLDDFAEDVLLGEDFGYVTRGRGKTSSSLDSFGNLECTPPHTGPSGDYPFGRTLFGGAQPGARRGRRMMKEVSDFLYAQRVQMPIELFSDWLTVGHIDEFMSFVPADNDRGFALVLASPDVAYGGLEAMVDAGLGDAVLLEGKHKQQSVKALLADEWLRKQNALFQEYIGWNKTLLVREMGLKASEVVSVPALYFAERHDGRADSYFPGMVNMQVLNRHLAIPKPFGPKRDGQCIWETEARRVLEPLGLTCHFVDTYDGYHRKLGEVHCGTNVVREPFKQPWWETLTD